MTVSQRCYGDVVQTHRVRLRVAAPCQEQDRGRAPKTTALEVIVCGDGWRSLDRDGRPLTSLDRFMVAS